jgi:tetratricopeptide (TPR) repeat protein
MARQSSQANPLVILRRSLRELRNEPQPAADPCRATLRDSVEIALFRLPQRQREIVRRYDLYGEPALEIQRALAISPRQFFRDRRAALTALRAHLPYVITFRPTTSPRVEAAHFTTNAGDAALVRRAFARSLAQAGNAHCLQVLDDLAQTVAEPSARADLLLEVAELATDYDDEPAARRALASAVRVLDGAGEVETGLGEYLNGRAARAQARLIESWPEASQKFLEAVAWLRRSAIFSNAIEANVALVETLGDIALLDFEAGSFTSARAASSQAVRIVEAFGIWTRPRSLEILAADACLDACLSGHSAAAIATISSLVRRAAESGWSATASRLGADLVGLHAISGKGSEAIRWYERMWPVALEGARPNDRWRLTVEAAGTYAMMRRPYESLTTLSRAKPGVGCPSAGVPSRHAFAAAALQQLGEHAKALDEARAALHGYVARHAGRGMSDAHRLIARSYAKLCDAQAAQEHIAEARRLSERYAMPEGLLCTVGAQAEILRSPALKAEAFELERVLHSQSRG